MTHETSTYFIKGQLKDVTAEKLLALYQDVLKDQNVSSFYTEGNTLYFKNDILNLFANQRFSKFSEFSDGSISIEENETDFIVFFRGNVKGVFVVPAIAAIIVMVFFLVGVRFNLSALFVGPVIFVILTVIKFLFVYGAFPVYFTSVRNDIELKYRNRYYGNR